MTSALSLLATATGRAEADLPQDAAIGTVEGWDSLAHMRLIAALETRLARPLTTEEALSVQDLASIQALLAPPETA